MGDKLFYIFVFIIIFNFLTYSQTNVTFFTEISYNNYAMTELKEQQIELLNSIRNNNIPAKITESYPAFYGFKLGFLIPLTENIKSTLSLGGLIRHESTGGRIHYQDYSGELRADQLVKATGIGVIIQYESHYSSDFNLGFNLSINYIYSSLSNNLYLKVGDETQDEVLDFSSYSFGIEPGIVPSLKVWELRFGIALSYLIYLPSSLEYDQISNAFLINDNGEKVNINWSGFRIGFIISIAL